METKDWLTLAVAVLAVGIAMWNLVVARAAARGTAEGQLSIAYREHIWRLHKEFGLSVEEIENLIRGETSRPGQTASLENNAYDSGYKRQVGSVEWILAPRSPRWSWREKQPDQ